MLSSKGQTLLELVVVVSVCVLVVSALVFATIASLRNAQFAKNQAQATKLAQEGIERVRVGRDRNDVISIYSSSVKSWNGDGTSGSPVWSYQIYNGCGSGGSCYFKFLANGGLTWISTSNTFPISGMEDVYGDGKFKRAIILSDDSFTFGSQKTVTVIVKWTDFSGSHQSRLTTILGSKSQ